MGDRVVTHPLPESRQTELALLDVLLVDPQRVIRHCWAAGLTADDFATHRHGVMYAKIVERLHAGEDVDAITLCDALRHDTVTLDRKETNALSYVGGQAAIMGLSSAIGIVAMSRAYADEIVSLANSRAIVMAGELLAQQGSELAPVSDTVTSAESILAKIRDRAEGRHDGTRSSDIGSIVESVVRQYQSDEPDDTIPFDLPSLNAIGGGMFPGDVIIVGARSGVGKSWTGLAHIEKAVKQRRRSALFSLEMPAEQMVRRLIAMGGHNLTGIRRRLLPYSAIEDRAVEVGEWTGLLDVFDGSCNVDRIQSVLASARIEGKPYRLAVIDHVHLLEIPGPGNAYRLGLNTALTRLKHMAIEHGVTLVLLAQLKRPETKPKADGSKPPTPKPNKHDLRESGGLGDIADYVLMVHRDEDENGNELTTGELIVDKVRDGAGTGDIPVIFDTKYYRFKERHVGYVAGAPSGRELA